MAVSKVEQKKQAQGYVAKYEAPICGNCSNMTFDEEFPAWVKRENPNLSDAELFGKGYLKYETNLRCSIGGFAVKKQGSCLKHPKRS